MSSLKTLTVPLTASEITQLAEWHRECEKRCADMREYDLAAAHQDRHRLFNALKNSGPYMKAFHGESQ